MTPPASPAGLFASLRRLAGTALEIARVRLELLASELEQEKLRLFDALVIGAIGLVMVGLSMVLVVGFVVMLFQEGYRLPAVGVLALAFGLGGAWVLRRAREALRAGDGGPFALTLGELRRDEAGLGAAAATPPAAPAGDVAPARRGDGAA
ncbi:phage holin family protein [Ideonella sp. A 288]|uniref:phage holin family protein n=1 Tax=Ideonella sp. A 288 TaxID=1962181 RepID=UPI000B4B5F41|nr:phage holin family protein [Ideonella sp. A 288]